MKLWIEIALGAIGWLSLDFGYFLLKEYLWRRYCAKQRALESKWEVKTDLRADLSGK